MSKYMIEIGAVTDSELMAIIDLGMERDGFSDVLVEEDKTFLRYNTRGQRNAAYDAINRTHRGSIAIVVPATYMIKKYMKGIRNDS